jgi:signal transduction histidine kinase
MLAEQLLQEDLDRKATDSPKFQDYRLLVVEDDQLDWQLLNRYLKEVDPGCESTWCADGNSALEALPKDNYDCVFIDRELPDCVGEELIESLRIVSNDPWLPIVMVSGTQEVEVATGAIRKGATDYIPKNRLSGRSLQRVLINAVKQSRMGRSLDQERDHIRTLNEQLVKRNKEIQSFYHTVSHELKTPLTAIREFTSLINEGLLGPVSTEQTEALDYSISCCDRLVRLIGDLFDTARLENGKLDLSLEWFDPAKFVHAEVSVMDTIAKQQGITLRFSCSGPVPACRADRTRIGQVLSNLIGNALKFTPEGGVVEVALSFDRVQEQLIFEVRDTGPGIDPEQAARIFDRLYQVQGSPDADHSGMGIGLYLCRQIIEQHRGSMQVSSSLGHGSSFRARIPLMVTTQTAETS